MGAFDIYTDGPGLLRAESLNVTLAFERTGPDTGRVSWNIPQPAAGCAAGKQRYNGMVVTLDTVPSNISTAPINRQIYTGDPTADSALFAGDKLGTSKVIGAFYNDTTTNYFDVTGIKPNTPYYITGYPVDEQLRYFVEGVHSYSLDYVTGEGTLGSHAIQEVYLSPAPNPPGPYQQGGVISQPGISNGYGPSYDLAIQNYGAAWGNDFGPPSPPGVPNLLRLQAGYVPEYLGVKPTDATCLVPHINYFAWFNINHHPYTVVINGEDALTFGDLVDAFNKRFASLGVSLKGPFPPNAGGLYYNPQTKQLFKWDGYAYTQLPLILYATDPTDVQVGDYWLNPETNLMYQWDGTTWVPVPMITLSTDPSQPLCEGTYWFDGTTAWIWNGTTWCELTTYIDNTNPYLPPGDLCGAYWRNSDTEIFSLWSVDQQQWNAVVPIVYYTDPNNLPNGALWFNPSTSTLALFNNNVWLPQFVRIQEQEPQNPAPSVYWFDPLNQQLYQRDSSNTTWIPMPCMISLVDPTNRTSCGLWYNDISQQLFIWNQSTSAWVLVTNFYNQVKDPSSVTIPPPGAVWYDPSTGLFYKWIGTECSEAWEVIEVINTPYDPSSSIPIGTVWHNTTDGKYYVWTDNPLPNHWEEIDPVIFPFAPNRLPAGTYWYNTSNDTLNYWNGVNWVNVTFSTQPLDPEVGTNWFNTDTNTLYTWNGIEWILGCPIASCQLDKRGYLVFKTMRVGEHAIIFVRTTATEEWARQFYLDYWNQVTPGANTNFQAPVFSIQPWDSIPIDTVTGGSGIYPAANSLSGYTAGSLFDTMATCYAVRFSVPVPGHDGVSNEPSYNELGIGTNGDDGPRLDMENRIRTMLGYYTVGVELTKEQLDLCVTMALEELRQKSSRAYFHGFFFMPIQPGQQKFILSNKSQNQNKIVNIQGIYRLTSAFISSAHGAGVYGQIVLQHLYNMGNFDLLSYHIISEYVHLMEILFAARLTFTWHERTRELSIFHRFQFAELVAVETSLERTEQQLITDRWLKPWITKFGAAKAMEMLANIRGKYSTLPGAGGSVTLNARELRARAAELFAECKEELEQYQADLPEEYGLGTQFTFG